MKDRIKEIRKLNGLTQTEFAKKLGIKQNTVAVYEMGKSGISDGMINSICRTFDISEDWLRTGNGDMKVKKPKYDGKLSRYLAEINSGDDDFIKDFIEAYMELDEDSKKALRILADNMVQKRRGD